LRLVDVKPLPGSTSYLHEGSEPMLSMGHPLPQA